MVPFHIILGSEVLGPEQQATARSLRRRVLVAGSKFVASMKLAARRIDSQAEGSDASARTNLLRYATLRNMKHADRNSQAHVGQ